MGIQSNHNKRFILAVMFTITLLFAITNIYADINLNPFATSKLYEKNITEDMSDFIKLDFNSKYGVIRLSNTFLWITTDKIAEYSLTKNTEVCKGLYCEAEGKVTLYQKGKLFDNFKYFNLNGKETNIQDSKIYIYYGLTGKDSNIPNTFKESCYVALNGTKVCEYIVDTWLPEEIWKEYSGEVLEIGDYRWKKTGILNYESVDFVPIAFNKEFTEWANWVYTAERYAYNSSITSGEGVNNGNGWKFIANTNFSMINVTVFPLTSANRITLRMGDKTTILSNASISGQGGYASFDYPVNLTAGDYYYLMMEGGNYFQYSNTHTLPEYLTEFNITETLDNDGNADAPHRNWGINKVSVGVYTDSPSMAILSSIPTNNTNISISSVTFGCNATSKIQNITSIILNVTGASSWTQKITGLNTPSYNATFINSTLIDGTYNWNCNAYGSEGVNSTSNTWAFIVNFTKVYLNSPADGTTIYSNPQEFNCSVIASPPTTIKNVSLWTNESGTWAINQTVLGYSFVEKLAKPTTTGGLCGGKGGMKVTMKEDTNLYKITKEKGTGIEPTKCYVLNITKDVLNSSSFIGEDCFVSYFLINGTTYYFAGDNDGNNYNGIYGGATYPITTSPILDWVGGLSCGGDSNTEIDIISNITLRSNLYHENVPISMVINQPTLWTCQVCDSGDICRFASENRTLTIDTTAPTINISYPTTIIPYAYLGKNISLNYSITDHGVLSSCWKEYNNINTTISCTANNSLILTTQKNVTLYANDSMGNVASLFRSWEYSLFENERQYPPIISTTTLGSFYINFTTSTESSPVVYLDYNGTQYLSTMTGNTTNHRASNSINIYNDGEYSFRWIITYGGDSYYTYYSSHNVTNVSLMNVVDGQTCPAGLSKVMNFSFANEVNLTTLEGMDVKYNIKYGVSNLTGASAFGFLNSTNSFSFCINTSAVSEYYIGSGEIEYVKTDFVLRRYYIFSNTRITNTTIYTVLYDLPTALSTSFLIEFRQPTLTPYTGKYTSLLRWYPEINEYKIVEMGKTDDKGQTVKKVKTEDVDYRLGLYHENGTLINLINPLRMVCLTNPCSYTVTVSEITGSNFDEVNDIQANISFSDGVFTLIYSDPSQNTENMELRIYRMSSTGGDTLICNSNSTAFTGILTCNVSSYSGLMKATAVRTASPFREIALLIVDTSVNIYQGTFGLFIQFVITVVLVFLGIISPVTAIILGMLSLLFGTFLFKVITYPIMIGIGILGGIIIHFMRRGVQQ